MPDESVAPGRRVWLVRWPVTGPAEVLWTAVAGRTTTLVELASFEVLWPTVARHLRERRPANELELLVSTSRDTRYDRLDTVGTLIELDFDLRSGINFFPRASLQNVPVTSNNRALLMSKETVERKMREAAEHERFVPMPLWFGMFAATRPPDLFLSQQSEYESIFSPTRWQQVPDGAGVEVGSPAEQTLGEAVDREIDELS